MADLPIFAANLTIINGVSMASTINSSAIDISEAPGYCVHAIYTGSPTGTLTISGSNDGTNFVTQDTAAISAAGQHLYNTSSAHYRYMKVTYTFTSGTGSLTAYLSYKRN